MTTTRTVPRRTRLLVAALFAIATSTAVFGADTGLVRTISAQNALGRYSAIPRLIRYAVLSPLALSLGAVDRKSVV